jgi:hypothetical protein
MSTACLLPSWKGWIGSKSTIGTTATTGPAKPSTTPSISYPLFDKRQFRPYWIETGTPTFLVDVLTERQAWLPELGQLESSADILFTFDVDDMPTEALMFQARYMTIEREEEISGTY